jgi:hypothetical protein
MRLRGVLSALVFSVSFLMAADGFAQGRGQGRAGARMYDPKTVETVRGEVVSVEKIPEKGGMAGGIHLTLKTDKESVSVHLGPSWYLDQQSLKIAPKDQVEVRGSRITFEGKPAIIAAEVKKGQEVLKLRDDNGVPVWSGRRGRGGGQARP